MSSIDPAARRAQRNAVRFETNRGPAGPPGDPRLLLADIEVGQAVTKDEDGNPVSLPVATTAQSSVAVTYDAAGNPDSVTVDGQETTYEYDAAGNVQTINHADGRVETLSYDASGKYEGSEIA